MERLEGWGLGTSPEEGVKEGKQDQLVMKDDWKLVAMPLEDLQMKNKPVSKI